ncbi:MAG TPA: reverse transcriptase domain-containing protein [Allosphingosinicella sp.]|nr:reverse transcriptase domain-containing protein [Allosphingosinicella sp.]
MSSLNKVFDLGNLRRAYQWLLTNPNVHYRSFFQDSYDAFALASDTFLRRIRKDGLSHRYSPSHAAKVMVPKQSGTLRPLTLLTAEDQVVYQAIVNVIAEALRPRTKFRYRKRVFNHLYAGKSSRYFYLRWQDSYRLYGRRIKYLYDQGFEHIAEFDLAAFYDSIDHNVIRHFLNGIRIEREVIDLLMTCLGHWTSSTWTNGPTTIYHGHGIPQGPLSSGMLSEVVLQHIDAAGERGRKTHYLRYVDDIKILAKSEGELRRKLIALDLASKEVGLFPQTSKINIRVIADPADEVKSISRPPEPSITPVVDDKKLVRRLLELSRRGRISPSLSSRFTFLLANASPSQRLSARLLEVSRHHPEFSNPIGRYFSRYRTMPSSLAQKVFALLQEPELYQSVNGDFLRGCLGAMPTTEALSVGTFCADRLLRPATGLLPLQPTYKEALIAWALKTGRISYAEFEGLLKQESDWWVRKSMLREVRSSQFGPGSYRDLLNVALRVDDGETAMCAAARLVTETVSLQRPYGNVHEAGKIILRTAKVIKSAGGRPSLIEPVLRYVLKRPASNYDWLKFFAAGHRHAEQMAIFLKQSFETDIDAFLTRLDSFADGITAELFRRFVPGKACPAYGSAVHHPTLVATLPFTMGAFQTLHNLRVASITAHPRSLKTGVGTRRLTQTDYRKIRPALHAAFGELESLVAP